MSRGKERFLVVVPTRKEIAGTPTSYSVGRSSIRVRLEWRWIRKPCFPAILSQVSASILSSSSSLSLPLSRPVLLLFPSWALLCVLQGAGLALSVLRPCLELVSKLNVVKCYFSSSSLPGRPLLSFPFLFFFTPSIRRPPPFVVFTGTF